jgi:hypothetical protein
MIDLSGNERLAYEALTKREIIAGNINLPLETLRVAAAASAIDAATMRGEFPMNEVNCTELRQLFSSLANLADKLIQATL